MRKYRRVHKSMIQFFALSSEPVIINGWNLLRKDDIYLLPFMRTRVISVFSLMKCKTDIEVSTSGYCGIILAGITFLHACSTAVM